MWIFHASWILSSFHIYLRLLNEQKKRKFPIYFNKKKIEMELKKKYQEIFLSIPHLLLRNLKANFKEEKKEILEVLSEFFQKNLIKKIEWQKNEKIFKFYQIII